MESIVGQGSVFRIEMDLIEDRELHPELANLAPHYGRLLEHAVHQGTVEVDEARRQ